MREKLIDALTAEQKAELLEGPTEYLGSRAITVRLSEIQPTKVSWLWKPYIPLGKLTLVEGDPGEGKTWLCLAIAAAVTTGGRLPHPLTGRPLDAREPAAVIYLTAEDGLGDTLRPRLDAVKAEVSRVYAITGVDAGDGKPMPWTFDQSLELEAEILKTGAKLVVIDPLQAFLGARVDFHRANETRPKMAALASLAERTGCAVICIRHLSKATGKTLYRGMGSIDFTAAARSVLLVGQDQGESGRRALIQIKSSLAPTGPAQGFELTLEGGFRWTGFSTLTAEDVVGHPPARHERSTLQDAVEWLRDFLVDGPKEFPAIDKAARRQDIKPRTLRRAKEQLMETGELRQSKKAFKGPWTWELTTPNKEQPEGEVGQVALKGLDGQVRKINQNHIYQGFKGGIEVDRVVKFDDQEADHMVQFGTGSQANSAKGSAEVANLTMLDPGSSSGDGCKVHPTRQDCLETGQCRNITTPCNLTPIWGEDGLSGRCRERGGGRDG